jgi:glycosyltransferase involved in cell wall biosynthesis
LLLILVRDCGKIRGMNGQARRRDPSTNVGPARQEKRINRVASVTVVIPTRNRASLVRLSILSALRQRGVDVEVIVVDDASTDDTAHIVSRSGDRRVRLLRQASNGGVSAARNRGIEEARGEWISFLDDDDLWSPQKLVLQLEALRNSGRTWAFAGDVTVGEDLRVRTGLPPPTPEEVMEALPRYNPVPSGASNVIVRSDALADAGPFDPNLRRTEDWDMWLRLARIGPPAYVPRPLVAYRFHRANIAGETKAIVEEPDLLASRYGIQVDRAAMHRRAAWTCLRAGNRSGAVGHYARAVRLGDVKSLARAAVTLIHPAVGSDRILGLLRGSTTDERWRAEAQAWLDELSGLQATLMNPSRPEPDAE